MTAHRASPSRQCLERAVASRAHRGALLVVAWLCIAAADRAGAIPSTQVKERSALAARLALRAPAEQGIGGGPDRRQIGQWPSRWSAGLRGIMRGIDYSTYLGGQGSDVIHSIVVRDDGAMYMAGNTYSLDIFNGDTPRHKGSDAFVVLLAPDGQQIVSSVVIGGSGEIDIALALHLRGDILYVGGSTNSPDFPTTDDAYQRDFQGTHDGFLIQLAAGDLTVIYSTFIGGSGVDAVTGVAGDGSGEVFLTGLTRSADFIRSSTLGNCREDEDAFLVKLDPSGRAPEYGACVGGSGGDFALAVALDEQTGTAVIVGSTNSLDFPIRHAVQSEFGGSENDGFVAAIDQQSGELRSATYLGGRFGDQAWGVATDGSGAAYVVGSSDSPDFPITHEFDGPAGELRGFITKLVLGDGGSLSLGYSRLLGGAEPSPFGTAALDVVVDAAGNPVVVGNTNSPDFPVKHAPQPDYAGFGDAFVAELSSEDGEVGFSTFIGGSSNDNPNAVAVSGEAIYVAGVTQSTDFPIVQSFQGRPYGGDAFVTRIVRHEVAHICLYVTNGTAGSVTVLDAARRRAVGALGDGMLAPIVSAVAVAPDSALLYILERSGAGVGVMDSRTGDFARRFGPFVIPQDLFLSRDGRTLFVIDAPGLTAADVESGEPLATVPIFQASRAAVDAAAGLAFVLGDNGSHVYVVELSGPNISRDFALGPGSLAVDVALVATEQVVLVVESLLSRLVARDTESGTVRWQVPIGPGAQIVAISPDERFAFVGHRYGTGSVTVVDMVEQRIVALLSFESGVEDLAVTPDGVSLYIATGAPGQVWVVDIKTLQIIGHIPLGRPAEKVAVGTSRNGCRPEVPCDGDCNGDGDVKVDELVTVVGVSLGTVDRSACGSLSDGDPVTIDYLVGAVRASLEGCAFAENSSARLRIVPTT